jgi:hypothetical protein
MLKENQVIQIQQINAEILFSKFESIEKKA